jgi:class 3 adenylate cyclase
VTGRLELRAGIQTGFCTVGVFGSDLLRSYTAVGSPVTVASALRDDASPGMIVSGPAAWALLEDVPGMRAKARGARSLNGVARPMESHEIVGIAGVQPPIERPTQRWRELSFMPR